MTDDKERGGREGGYVFWSGRSKAKPVKTRRVSVGKEKKSINRSVRGANSRNLLNSLSALWELETLEPSSQLCEKDEGNGDGDGSARKEQKEDEDVKREMAWEHLRERRSLGPIKDHHRAFLLLLSYLFHFSRKPFVIAVSCEIEFNWFEIETNIFHNYVLSIK